MISLHRHLANEVHKYVDNRAKTFQDLGVKYYRAFGTDQHAISSQIRNLEQITYQAERLVDIENFIKIQMGKDGGGAANWRKVGKETLVELNKFREDAKAHVKGFIKDHKDYALPEHLTQQDLELEVRLRLGRGCIRTLVSEYLFQKALNDQGFREQPVGGAAG
ncbi:MAG: hypothetical protein KDA84_19230 [Planctomycetaceae bacterium]|nr:hypothetical protein [Planctomycetaceae bacterium]